MTTKSEELKQEFVNSVKYSPNFYASVTYVKEKIMKVSVFRSNDKKAFTVHCSSKIEHKPGASVRTVQYISLEENTLASYEALSLGNLLQKAGILVNNLRELEEDWK
ncbi:hypothetical protein EFS28_09695 [Lactobacillus acidophilus]|uniref:hypothetical protein n=1 Tax=Lactobacillus acidophilus TaxID=1579 RepID=UPI0021A3B441|nr:hypothetical protein [Lactobacillus acidophilus]MCT3602223.1 hypothetical protein [Lactobacillus acidophilus]MCT3624463.1 hypothetical protein [Lactobacillus acidophilus]